MRGHAAGHNVELGVGEPQIRCVHHLEARLRARPARPGSFNLLRIYVDSDDLQAAFPGNFAGRRAHAAADIQIPPAGLEIDTVEQELRAMRNLDRMPRPVDEALFEGGHSHLDVLLLRCMKRYAEWPKNVPI